MPPFNVEFYKPAVLQPDNVAFRALLSRLCDYGIQQRIRRGDDPALVLNVEGSEHDVLGEAARIRMEDLPSIIDTADGTRHDLNVGEREGLGEEIHFLYDFDTDVIAIQSRGHFRSGALEKLLGDLTEASLDFRVILTPDAWQRFNRMGIVTKVDVTIARPNDVQDGPMLPLTRVFREIDEFNGVAAKLEISVRRERHRSLRLDAVRALVARFQDRPDEFKSLSITGAIRENDEVDAVSRRGVIDFVHGRLVYSEEVNRVGRGRRLDPEGCRLALRRAVRHHRAHLRRHRQ